MGIRACLDLGAPTIPLVLEQNKTISHILSHDKAESEIFWFLVSGLQYKSAFQVSYAKQLYQGERRPTSLLVHRGTDKGKDIRARISTKESVPSTQIILSKVRPSK